MSFNWDLVKDKARIKSPENETIYLRFPLSEFTETLPAGKPSGVITSFVEKKVNGVNELFYQLDGANYLKHSPRLQFVENDTPDDSGFLNSISAGVGDAFKNTKTKAQKNVGFLGDGIKATANRSFFDMLDFAGLSQIKNFIYAFFILLAVMVFLQFKK